MTDQFAGMNSMQIIAFVKKQREASNLMVTFIIPADEFGPEREWPCYPSSHDQKIKWIEQKAKKGWTVK